MKNRYDDQDRGSRRTFQERAYRTAARLVVSVASVASVVHSASIAVMQRGVGRDEHTGLCGLRCACSLQVKQSWQAHSASLPEQPPRRSTGLLRVGRCNDKSLESLESLVSPRQREPPCAGHASPVAAHRSVDHSRTRDGGPSDTIGSGASMLVSQLRGERSHPWHDKVCYGFTSSFPILFLLYSHFYVSTKFFKLKKSERNKVNKMQKKRKGPTTSREK